MVKKIIFVGPPGAGKTTLRKVFFEGENSTNLLEFALEPTHGLESMILDLRENIGIFDLAGQENQRWVESEEKSIFNNTEIILIVLDIETQIDEILGFFNKIKKIRNDYSPTAMIYILIHKIDLSNQNDLMNKKYALSNSIRNEELVKVLYTSIKKEFYTKTFSSFIEILKTCLKDNTNTEELLPHLLENAIELLYKIDNEIVTSKKEIQLELNINESDLETLLEYLVQKEQIEIKTINENEKILSLSEGGKSHIKEFFKNFSFENISNLKQDPSISVFPTKILIPPFLGFLISDKSGRTLLSVELRDGLLHSLFDRSDENGCNKKNLDLDLISMFISALEKFALEINIRDLSGFTLMGSNLKMYIFNFGDFVVVFFTNPNIRLKSIEYKIKSYFMTLFEEYQDSFNKCVQTDSIEGVLFLREKGIKWLEDMNKSYEHMAINYEIFDTDQAIMLYNELEDLHDDINIEYSIILEKIKTLKVNLMKAILDDDLEDVKSINEKIQILKLKIIT